MERNALNAIFLQKPPQGQDHLFIHSVSSLFDKKPKKTTSSKCVTVDTYTFAFGGKGWKLYQFLMIMSMRH